MPNTQFNPFLFHSNQLQALFAKASQQKNPALWLYTNDARTKLFMLEALTKLHHAAFDEKIFGKWNNRFKKLEDELGQMDYYVEFEKEFKSNKKIPKEISTFLSSAVMASAESLNQRLINKGWLKGKLLDFNVKISKFYCHYDEAYLNEIKFAIHDELQKIISFCEKVNYSFTDLENEVHEIRRKLRWISIYGQALNGLIQLKKSTKKPSYDTNYFTKEILSSPYNKLPNKPNGTAIMEYDSNSFFALSYVIKELGSLKDNGLKIEIATQAFAKTENITNIQANKKALKALGLKLHTKDEILKTASELLFTSLSKDKILNGLLVK
jgi:hypothetical protein